MDAIAEWTAAYERVVALTENLDEEAAGTIVPACPAWTVRDLLSHMVGLGVDYVAGTAPEDHNPGWTDQQVADRAGHPVPDLLAEWASVVTPLRGWMRANGARPLGDVIIHEQDLRGALGEPGGQDTPGLRAIRDRMLGRFGPAVAELPPIALVSDTWEWCSDGEVADAEVVVRAPEFDLARALMTRRSEAQLRSWTERGDIAPYLPSFAGLGPLPEADLSE